MFFPFCFVSFFTYFRVHETQWQTHGNRQEPYECDFQYHSPSGLVPAEFHWISQTQVPVHAYGAQVHYASRAEQHVQTYPCQAIDRSERKLTWNQSSRESTTMDGLSDKKSREKNVIVFSRIILRANRRSLWCWKRILTKPRSPAVLT